MHKNEIKNLESVTSDYQKKYGELRAKYHQMMDTLKDKETTIITLNEKYKHLEER